VIIRPRIIRHMRATLAPINLCVGQSLAISAVVVRLSALASVDSSVFCGRFNCGAVVLEGSPPLISLCGDFAMDVKFATRGRVLVVVACLFGCGRVFAGSPPLITDDPETPGYHGWEINITSSLEHTHDGSEIEAPLFDINYGLTSDRDQLKVEFAVLDNDPEDADSEWGISDLLVGYKYRFIDEDDTCSKWMVSFYPQVSSPTGDESRGLGSGQTELFLPFEFQKNFCDGKAWINPEIGYNIVLGDNGGPNSWKFGLAMGKEVTDKLELEGEVGAFVFEGDSLHSGEPDVPFFNFGFEYRCDKNIVLLGSAGRSFRAGSDGVPDFFCLLGVQILLGKAAEEEEAPGNDEEKDKGGEEDMKDPADEAGIPYPAYLRHDHIAVPHQHINQFLVNPAS
jgi:hypothetical protein